VNSKPAIKFRKWANKVIKEYIIKGFALDDERFIKGNKIDSKYISSMDIMLNKYLDENKD